MTREDKRVRGAQRGRRATTQLATLGWLEGFPDGSRWQPIAGDAIELSGLMLSRARRTARTLLREHRDELAQAVGDVDRWWAIVDHVLGWAARREAELDLLERAPPRIARAGHAVIARHPALRPHVVAAGIAWALDPGLLRRGAPDRLGRALAWLERHAADAREIGVTAALRLAWLAEHDNRGADALRALIVTDAPDALQAIEALQNLIQRLRGRQAGAAAAPRRSRAVAIAWLARLVAQPARHRGRALAVLGAIDPVAAITPWREWEQASAAEIARTTALPASDVAWPGSPAASVRCEALSRLRDRAPPAVRIGEVLAEVDALAAVSDETWFVGARRLLDAAARSAGPLERVRLARHLARVASRAEAASDRRVPWLWHALAAASPDGSTGVLAPWLADPHDWLERDLVEPHRRRADIERLVGVLVTLAAHAPSARDAEHASLLLAAGLPASMIAGVVLALRDTPGELSEATAHAAVALALPTGEHDIVGVARMVMPLDATLGWDAVRELAPMLVHAAAHDAGWLVRGALAAWQGKQLATIAGMLAVLPRSRWPEPVARGAAPRWLARYPAALAPALTRLAAVEPDAEAIARRRLANDLPDPRDLQRELAALAGRSDARIATRRANLEARLAAPRLPSASRLARLAAKLDRTAVAIGLARWQTEVTARSTAHLVHAFGLSAWPGWPLDRKTVAILVGLLRLAEPHRSLARRLVQRRAGPPPWHLHDEPANRVFLDRLRDAGLDAAPWLDDRPRTVIASDGAATELALTNDPLEVFAMGQHFDTCLAPRGGNFFSVLANAADVNKRVLYARRDGRVIGRCLLALTDALALLVFQPYCHVAIDFDAIVRDFALDLATRMGTELVPRGPVAVLVAHDWYDDGSRDLAGRFGELERLGRQIAALAPEQVPERLREALGRLDDVTLPLVLAMPAIQDRPQIVVARAPSLVASATSSIRITAARVALAAGERALADRLLGDHARSIELEEPAWWSSRIVAELRPSATLARLRATRRRGVRGFADDDAERMALAGACLEALRRPRQAATLYRLAIAKAPHLRADLLPRLGALERQ
jgi:hypothetical protein